MARIPLRWLRILALATTMTFVLATLIGLSGFVARQGSVALGASTTITIIAGEVSVRASDAEDFRPVADGALLRAGMTVQTGPDTHAVLTYFEGSTVSIDPNTTLVIEVLEANPDGSTVIAMRQDLGRTWHAVAKLVNPTSRYEVRTPTATATVRGTMFAVGVELDEQGEVVSTVETTEGAVATAKAPTAAEPQPQEVLVQPGFQVTVKTTAPIEQPKPAPEPDRKVTVTVGATAGLVVDPVGRANGIKDGKVVVQTPGATVKMVDGKLVITLPRIPDGKIATVLDAKGGPRDAVEVITTVSERGRSEQRTAERVEAAAPAAPAVAAVEVKKGETVAVASISDEQKREIASSVKVAEAPKRPAAEQRKSEESKERKEEKREGPGGPGGPPAPGGDLSGAPLGGKRPEPAKEQPKQEALKVEPPRVEPPKADPPKPEAPKAEPPKNEAPKVDAPRQDASRREPPKADAPKLEEPKQEQPKQEASREKGQPSNERSGFVPSVDLPSLPFGSEASAPKKEERAHPASDGASGKKDEAGTKKPSR